MHEPQHEEEDEAEHGDPLQGELKHSHVAPSCSGTRQRSTVGAGRGGGPVAAAGVLAGLDRGGLQKNASPPSTDTCAELQEPSPADMDSGSSPGLALMVTVRISRRCQLLPRG